MGFMEEKKPSPAHGINNDRKGETFDSLRESLASDPVAMKAADVMQELVMMGHVFLDALMSGDMQGAERAKSKLMERLSSMGMGSHEDILAVGSLVITISGSIPPDTYRKGGH